ncbi:hypothetical protein [Rhizobium sp. Root1220]|uniref:COG3650 family protein n=1 Tax=Rhizobium sp. Root1220 TaxID=1736432 RepID=UPI00070155BB|nr:hypothetical protein [Rhizobium sp. Root1220]KQV64590.1 hypothetical protein ASC90_17105 [Rhizobium sp. Root1220]
MKAAPGATRVLVCALTFCGHMATAAVAQDSGPEAMASELAGDLNALGTEPFWAVRIRADAVTFSRPGKDDVKSANPGPVTVEGGAVWTVGGGPSPFKLTLLKAECSDGMSDRNYGFRATLVFDSKTLYGCAASPAAIAAQPAP